MSSEFPSIFPLKVHTIRDPVNSCFETGLLSWDMSCNIFPEPMLFSDHVISSSPSGSDNYSNVSDNHISRNTIDNTSDDDVANKQRFPSIFSSEVHTTKDPVNSCFETGLLSCDMSCNIFSEPMLFSDHVISSSPSGSDNYSNVSDNPNSHNTVVNTPDDDVAVGNTPDDDVANERKRKRRASNRESAKRSRIRKQMHVENLKTELNRLKVENRGLADRVWSLSDRTRILVAENNRLRAEHDMLRLVLSDMNQMLLLRELQQWPCNNNQIIY